MGLGELPVELVLQITQDLGIVELNALAQRSRFLYQVLNDRLYQLDAQRCNSKALHWAARSHSYRTAVIAWNTATTQRQLHFPASNPPAGMLLPPSNTMDQTSRVSHLEVRRSRCRKRRADSFSPTVHFADAVIKVKSRHCNRRQ